MIPPLAGVIVYRGTARHGLVKHKHRETINKRNVARIPRYVSLSRWNPTEGKCPRPLPITLLLPLAFSRLSFSYGLGRDSVPFRFCLLVYEGNAIHPRPRKRRRGFPSNSRAPSKGKTEPPLFDSTLDLSRMRTPGPLWWYYYVLFRYYAKLFSLFVRIYHGNLRGNQPSNLNNRVNRLK